MRGVGKSTTNLIALRRTDDYLLAWFTEEFFKIPLSQMAHSRVSREAHVLQELPTDKFKRFLMKADLVHSPFVYTRARRGRLSSGGGEIAELDRFVVDFYETLKAAKMSHGDLHFNNILFNPESRQFHVIDWDLAVPSVTPFADIVNFYVHYVGFLQSSSYISALKLFLGEDTASV